MFVQAKCDYCFNSKDERIKAEATKCPGRFNVEWDKGQVRNANCPILQLNREKKKEQKRPSPTGIASATEIYSNNAYESLSEYGDEEMDIWAFIKYNYTSME